MYATATLKMAKSKTKVGNFCQKVIYFYVSSLANLLLPIFSKLFTENCRSCFPDTVCRGDWVKARRCSASLSLTFFSQHIWGSAKPCYLPRGIQLDSFGATVGGNNIFCGINFLTIILYNFRHLSNFYADIMIPLERVSNTGPGDWRKGCSQCCNNWNSQYYLNTIEIVMNYLNDYLK